MKVTTKNNNKDSNSISTIHADNPSIIKRRKTKIRQNRERLAALGLLKKPKMSKKNNKIVVQEKPEATVVVKILQHRTF